MQRLLSLATLAIMGGLGWMFLQGGGLSQIAEPRNGQQSGGYASGSYQTPGNWQASTGPTPRISPRIARLRPVGMCRHLLRRIFPAGQRFALRRSISKSLATPRRASRM